MNVVVPAIAAQPAQNTIYRWHFSNALRVEDGLGAAPPKRVAFRSPNLEVTYDDLPLLISLLIPDPEISHEPEAMRAEDV